MKLGMVNQLVNGFFPKNLHRNLTSPVLKNLKQLKISEFEMSGKVEKSEGKCPSKVAILNLSKKLLGF